ncbi:polyprenol phosphomannose-dependent alpha 1,6 mannosyltransferase MptB [Klenkia brasiliensis]|uniref:Alpha-1,6-mannosyltransferase n=1 Tax=Klenkia brasiliensis TaxID=333142 RepID=A0A1G7NAG3_9ACTN|nr:polyprenol phosphomannose-dependent alpha 1,6 mannosyltransferase MptB [Klenkia brasiliensis]SDF70984.1 alpha-1,6-mannosyltransferase [Klenkia brasiliensis]
MAGSTSRTPTAVRTAVPVDRTGLLVLTGCAVLPFVVALATAQAGVTQLIRLPDWWGGWPVRVPGEQLGWRVVAVLATAGWLASWAVLVRRLLRARTAPSGRDVTVVGALGAWGWVPFLVGGPTGSLDVGSYAAIGRLAALGLDPYRTFPIVLGDSFGAAVDPMWRRTPTPYGPLQVGLFRWVAELAGHDQQLAVLGIRAVAVLALAAGVVLVAAAAAPGDRAVAVALTAANPLLVVHVVGGAHVDVLVGVGAVGVLLLVRRGVTTAAVVVAVLLTFLKLPGALLVAFVLASLLRSPAPGARAALARAVGAAAVTTAAVLVLAPNPLGWVGAMGVPGTVRNGTAPSTWLSYLLSWAVRDLGLDGALTVGRLVAALVGAGLAAWLLWRAAAGTPRQAMATVGLALLVLALSGPALYPWYLTWGLFAVAAAGGLRARWAVVALSTYLGLAGSLTEGLTVQLVAGACALALAGGALWASDDLRALLLRRPWALARAGQTTVGG